MLLTRPTIDFRCYIPLCSKESARILADFFMKKYLQNFVDRIKRPE